MKKKVLDMINLLGMPVTMIVMGVVLTFSPDTASALVSKMIGWVLTAGGVCFGLGALFSQRKAGKIFWALVCFSIGGVLVSRPLLLAKNIGRFLGVLLAIEGGDTLRNGSKLLGMLILLAALGLIFAPMSASRLVLSLCGLVVLVIGVATLVDRFKRPSRLKSGKDDIIDAL